MEGKTSCIIPVVCKFSACSYQSEQLFDLLGSFLRVSCQHWLSYCAFLFQVFPRWMCRLFLALFQPFSYLLMHVCCFVLSACSALTFLSPLYFVSTVLIYIRCILWNWNFSDTFLLFFFFSFGHDLIGKSGSIWNVTDCSIGTVLVDGKCSLHLLGIGYQDCA